MVELREILGYFIWEKRENIPQNMVELREMYYLFKQKSLSNILLNRLLLSVFSITYSPGTPHTMPQDRDAIVLWTRLPIGHRTMMSTILSLPQQC